MTSGETVGSCGGAASAARQSSRRLTCGAATCMPKRDRPSTSSFNSGVAQETDLAAAQRGAQARAREEREMEDRCRAQARIQWLELFVAAR